MQYFSHTVKPIPCNSYKKADTPSVCLLDGLTTSRNWHYHSVATNSRDAMNYLYLSLPWCYSHVLGCVAYLRPGPKAQIVLRWCNHAQWLVKQTQFSAFLLWRPVCREQTVALATSLLVSHMNGHLLFGTSEGKGTFVYLNPTRDGYHQPMCVWITPTLLFMSGMHSSWYWLHTVPPRDEQLLPLGNSPTSQPSLEDWAREDLAIRSV